MKPLFVDVSLIFPAVLRPLGSAYVFLQIGQVDKLIGLAPQLIGNHGGLG
jgi:hypothetical protein